MRGGLPIVPRALSFFPLPSLLKTQRGLCCGGESHCNITFLSVY